MKQFHLKEIISHLAKYSLLFIILVYEFLLQNKRKNSWEAKPQGSCQL